MFSPLSLFHALNLFLSLSPSAGAFNGLTRNNVTLFQNELSANGPLQACFTVYENFYTFFDASPAGVYTSASGTVVGGHCVKMVGWGVDTSAGPYWLFANRCVSVSTCDLCESITLTPLLLAHTYISFPLPLSLSLFIQKYFHKDLARHHNKYYAKFPDLDFK